MTRGDDVAPARASRALPFLLALGCGTPLVLASLWLRSLGLVCGETAVSRSVAVVTALAGLALGSALAGRRPSRDPLRAFARVQLALGAFALLGLPLLSGACSYGALLGALVLLPPMLLAGAALPFAFGSVALRSVAHAAGESRVGGLFGQISLAGASALALASFVLLPALGARGTLVVAAAASVLVGVATQRRARAIAADRVAPGPALHDGEPRDPAGPFRSFFGLASLLAAAAGALVLAAQLLARSSSLVGSLLDASPAVAVLSGLAVGAAIDARWRLAATLRAVAFALLGALAGALVSAWLVERLPSLWPGLAGRLPLALLAHQLAALALSFVALLPATALVALAFAMLTRVGDADASRERGRLFTGAALGGALAVLVLVLGSGLVRRSGHPRSAREVVADAAAASAGAASSGAASADAGAADAAGTPAAAAARVLAAEAVRAAEHGIARKLLAHVPMLLHGEPRRILVIGAADVARSAALHGGDVERLAAEEGGARKRLLRARARYDVVLCDSVAADERTPGAGLLTREAYQTARAALATRGLFAERLRYRALEPSELRRALRTFALVFPETTLWLVPPSVVGGSPTLGGDLLLVGGLAPQAIDWPRLERAYADARLAADLAATRVLVDPVAVAATWAMARAELERFASGGTSVDTDDDPGSELVALRRALVQPVEGRRRTTQLHESLERAAGEVSSVLVGQPLLAAGGPIGAVFLDRLGERYARSAQPERAIRAFEAALRRDPNDAAAHARAGELLLEGSRPGEAESHLAAAVRIDGTLVRAWDALGALALDRRDYPRAEQAERALLRLEPANVSAWLHLGAALARQGKWAGASDAFDTALSIDPRAPIDPTLRAYAARQARGVSPVVPFGNAGTARRPR